MSIKKTLPMVLILSILFSFNIFAMSKSDNKYSDPVPITPQNEYKNEDRSLDFRWVWLSDSLCVQFKLGGNVERNRIEDMWNRGMASRWNEYVNGKYQSKTRDTYSGKWSQSTDGIWSFEFDDKTIPVGVTKIDGVLYAFTGYGELKDGYEYYPGSKTAVDGLVKTDSTEFTQWLATQYLPDCTSHE